MDDFDSYTKYKYKGSYETPQRPTPKREWVGLTDEEIDTMNIVGHETLRQFVRAIEAKLKEKNG